MLEPKVFHERNGRISAATQHLFILEQIFLFSDRKDPMTARFVEYLYLCEPDARVLKLNGLVQVIMEEQSYPTPGYMECKFCDYRGICQGKEKGEGE